MQEEIRLLRESSATIDGSSEMHARVVTAEVRAVFFQLSDEYYILLVAGSVQGIARSCGEG